MSSFITVQAEDASTDIPEYTFAVVPQQSASKLARLWTPILKKVGQEAGVILKFKTAPNIPTFEKRLVNSEYDFAYMNPYHYTAFNQNPGYQAIAKAANKRIKGIVVVRKDSHVTKLTDLEGETLAFPSPAAFAATILPMAYFSKIGLNITPKYVSSHDSVYRTVAQGHFPAGGGVMRTFKNMTPDIREQLKILWATEEYTPHAFAVHPRVDTIVKNKIQKAFIALSQQDEGKQLLNTIKLKGISSAKDEDWNDIRQLNIRLLNDLIQ
ncbi:MAG: phosphate/phosphite/phosphonate ABC transporter substrate-binding protein [Gammaproteobacteria bacterium]|nr:phosphate/phosphite/phosphonate ABC transporter substrate-binding protein [Gammaproteobacteria bacterium]